MRKSTTNRGSAAHDPDLLILLDTHIAVWLRQTSSRLKASTLQLLEEKFHQRKLCISAISAWELGMLVAHNKLNLGQPPLVWFDGFVQNFKVNVLDINPEIAMSSNFMPGKFHSDPADRILVASALVHSAAIVTADTKLILYGQQGFARIIAC